MLTVRRKIGDTEITYSVEGRDLKEDIVKIAWLTTLPTTCGACRSDRIQLNGRVTKEGEYIYVELQCKSCRAKAQFGEYKSPKGALFLKRDWVKWEGEQKQANPEGSSEFTEPSQ